MGHQQARLSAAGGKPHTIDHIIQTGLENLEQIQTGQATAALCRFNVAMELPLEDAIHAACFLLGAQLACIVGFAASASPVGAGAGTAMLTGSEAALFK